MSKTISAEEFNRLTAKQGAKGNKYQANRCEVEIDGELVKFASHAEASRFLDLKRLEQAGEIEGLVRQPRFDLHVNGKRIGAYVGDAMYWDVATQQRIVEDVKGYWSRTPIYAWKKKHMLLEHGIAITEVQS